MINEPIHPDRKNPQALRLAVQSANRHGRAWSARGGKVAGHMAAQYARMAARCNALLRLLTERA